MRAPERRVVTLCFADLSGYTALVEDLDPEVAHEAVQPLMRRLRKLCESFGALVPGVQGDGFMAVFGLPVTHEDDVRRALDAAASMQLVVSEWQLGVVIDAPPLTLHIGVHTGAVLAAPAREPGGWSITGDAVNVASRLCGHADGAAVLVSEQTRALSGMSAGFGRTTGFAIRGRRETVMASFWAWSDAIVPGRRPVRWGSPLVNRQDELRTLSSAWTATEPRAWLLTGEPGVGKTRLAMEWARREDALLVAITTRAFGEAAWWEPLHEATRALAPSGSVHDLLRLVDPETVTPLSRQRWISLLGPVGLDARASASGFADLMQALATQRRVVLLLDDGQDASPELVAAVVEIAMAGPVSGLAVVATGRLGTRLPEPFAPISVEPLSDRQSDQLIRALLTEPAPEVVAGISSSAGGNPFFVEEIVHFLGSRATSEVPELARLDGLATGALGMRTFVAARVDAQDPDARAVLAALAVIRDAAPLDLLRHLEPLATDEALRRLGHDGMLTSPSAPGTAPEFRHGVTKEVVLAGISFSAARQAHTLAAEFYQRRLAVEHDSLQLLAGRASHTGAAYDLGVAGSLREQGLQPLRMLAAEAKVSWAESLHLADPVTVVSVADSARLLARGAGALAPELLLRLDLIDLARAIDRGVDEGTVATLARLAEAASTLGSRFQQRVRFLQGQALFDAGHRERARLLLSEIAVEAEDDPGLHDRVLLARGEMQETAQSALTAFALSAELAHGRASRLTALTRCAMMANYVDIRETRRYLSLAADLLGDGDVVAEAWLILCASWGWLYDQRFDRAADEAERVLATGVVDHLWQLEGHAVFVAAEAFLRAGNRRRSRALLGTVEVRVRSRAHSKGTITLQRLLALQCLREGDTPGSASALRVVSAVAGDDTLDEGSAADVRGECLSERGFFAAAATEFHAAHVVAVGAGNTVKAASIGIKLLRAEAASGGDVPEALLGRLVVAARGAGAEHTAELMPAWAAHAAARAAHGAAVPDPLAFSPHPDLPEEQAVAADLRALADPTDAHSALSEALAHWTTLGSSVWRARSGFWLAEATGDEEHARTARGVLATLKSPAGLEELFHEQWRTVQARM